MTYASWMPRHRLMTAAPGRLDLFVVTFVDGVRAALHPVTDYEAVLAEAHNIVRDYKRQVKVLPMTGTEVFNLLGIKPSEPPSPFDPELRRQMIERLKGIARDSADDDARRDAFDLLTEMGAIQL